MIFKILQINKEELLKDIYEYIDIHSNKKELNKEIKKIFNLESTINTLSIRYAVMALKGFEDSGQITEKLISSIIGSINLRNGENIYKYECFTKTHEQNIKVFMEIKRKDNITDYYSFYLEEAFNEFNSAKVNVQELIVENIKIYIDLMYKYADKYLELVQNKEVEFNDERFIKELIYIIGDNDSNIIYEELNGYNKK